MRYRRFWVPGGTYFFTVNLADRSQTLLVDRIDILRAAFRTVKSKHPFHVDALVVLPDHLHAIWTLPENDHDFAVRWALIKSHFSRQLPKIEYCRDSRIKKRERGIWQRRYWEHLIRNNNDFQRHIDYIHFNPVKHGLVKTAIEWPYSSFHQYVNDGIYPQNWSLR